MSLDDTARAVAGASPLLWPTDDTPIEPLGHANGTCYYLNANGQISVLTANQHSLLNILSLCAGKVDWLRAQFPRLNGKGELIGWNPPAAAAWLMAECSRKGFFDRLVRCRDVGAWRATDGSLILHCGDEVLIGGRWYPSGFVIEGDVYAAGPSQLHPSAVPATAAEVCELLGVLQSWNWRRPEEAPRLLLGWIGAAMVCGALRWRPHVWLTGTSATGKSTAERFVSDILGRLLLRAADPTAAGIRQALSDMARPVAVDEIEVSATNQRAPQVVELARLASTEAQGAILRGSPEGRPMAFLIRACFFFSSVLHPQMKPQDRSRITILDLEELFATPQERLAHTERLNRLRSMGPRILARIVEGWDRFQANLDSLAEALNAMGANLRVEDQLGTMLAMADTLLNDRPATPETAAEFLRTFDVDKFSDRHGGADHEECLQHLAGASTEIVRGGRRLTLGELLRDGCQAGASDDRSALMSIGIKLVDPEGRPRWSPALGEPAVAVAHQHPGLSRIFAQSRWADGVWVQSLNRVPGASPSGKTMNFAGVRSRAVLVPLYLLAAPAGDQEE